MSQRSLFRVVLIGGIIAAIISLIASLLLEYTLPIELQNYIDNSVSTDFTIIELTISVVALIIILALLIVSAVGLWFFLAWARTLYIIMMIISLPVNLFFGPVVMNEWEALFMDIATILEGALIVIMFTGSVGEEFRKRLKVS